MVQFSSIVQSNYLRPHESQHARPPCSSPTPRAYPNSCPPSRRCHPTISSSVVPFSSRPQSFPASGSFQMSQFFASGGQSIGVASSASVLPMNIQDWFPLGWTGWISLNPRDSQESSPTLQFKSINSSTLGFLYSPTVTSIHDYWKNHSEVAQSCLTLCDHMNWGPPGSSVLGILQARILEWVAISFSRGTSWSRDRIQFSRIAGRCINLWATREARSLD